MEKGYTQKLADFLAGVSYEQIPQSALDQAKIMTLHTVGAAIASMGLENAKNPIALAMEVGGKPTSTVWGRNDGTKVAAQEAAFANGTLSDLMDWEDCSWTGHGSAGLIPVAMALGEQEHISGKDYLTAVVTGFEGYHRIAMAVQPSLDYLRSGIGWGLVSWQIFAASIPAGKIKKFNGIQFNQLFGASQYNTVVPTNRHSEGNRKSDVYHYCHGFCARNGIVAANVTEKGFSNLDNCFEGNKSAYWQFVSDRMDYEWLTRGLGEEWYIKSTYFKHWPANMWIQTSLEALDILYRKHPFTLGEVDKIRVSPTMEMICANYADSSRTALDSQFSAGYCLTSYILDPTHTKGAHWFTEDKLNDPALIEFADTRYEFFGPVKTPLGCFEEFRTGSFPDATVEVLLSDGTVLSESCRYPKGHPRNNFTLEEECQHFYDCCKPYMPEAQIRMIQDKVMHLENLEDICELAEQLVIREEA